MTLAPGMPSINRRPTNVHGRRARGEITGCGGIRYAVELRCPTLLDLGRCGPDRSPQAFGCSVRTLDAPLDDGPVGWPFMSAAYKQHHATVSEF